MRDAAFACIRRIGVETGGSNIQFAVDPADGDQVVIEMNPRVSRSSRAGLQGHRVPDRQDRRPPGGRLHPGRDPQRHHRPDARLLRADDRLRGHQGSPMGVREVPRDPRGARHPDAVGGRGHGHRPDLPRVPAERRCGPWSGAGSASTAIPVRRCYDGWDDDELVRPGRRRHSRPAVPSGGGHAAGDHRRADLRGHRRRPVVPRSDRPRSSRSEADWPNCGGPADCAGRVAPGQAAGFLRRPAGLAVGRRRGRRCGPPGWRPGCGPP